MGRVLYPRDLDKASEFFVTIEDMVADGDEVVVRWTVRGTHEGELTSIPLPTAR